ncbi:hypothetical protein [Lysinibacter cavernae]|uniref:MmpS family membrane protein n=1 Tax=Lysinibacter cavernae TaxID=1640652 RepID=A0A7X5QZ01_9MICO|nr:hypothetical protein [Lysinibacter cavernae]NIH52573.1 hypothetical protein [Lysinibacter cavernae]
MRKPFGTSSRSSVIRPVLVLAVIGVMTLSGCAASDSAQPQQSASVQPSAPPTPNASNPDVAETPGLVNKTAETTAETTVEFRVTGDAGTALVRNVVVLTDADSNGDTTKHDLPWSETVTLTAAETEGFHKLVLFAKNVDGERGNISCEITVNGEAVAAEQTTGFQPVTCLYVSN